jgi:hypothetical protein
MLYAAQLGLDPRRFEDDLANDNHTWRIEEDCLGGERAGVGGTPALFVNGVRYAGHIDLDGLLTAVEDASGSTGSSLGGGGVPERTGPLAGLLEEICSERRGVNNRTLRRVVNLAVEIAREGREGRKELAQLDGAFVVSDGGVVLSGARYIDAASEHLELHLGSAAATWPPPPYPAERRPWRWRSLRARR